MRRSGLTALLGMTLLIALVSACGGGSSTTGSTASGSSTTFAGPEAAAGRGAREGSSRRSGPLPGHPKIGQASGGAGQEAATAPKLGPGPGGAVPKPTGKHGEGTTGSTARSPAPVSGRHAQAARKTLRSGAGAAAPFLVARGDNSIPTYGSEASGPQLTAAEAALSSYLAARAEGAWTRACSLISASVAKQLEALAGAAGANQSCATTYAKLSEGVPAAARADPLTGGLAALRIESPHAFALFVGSGGQQYMMPLEEEGGGWKVTQIEPVPWPIGSSAK